MIFYTLQGPKHKLEIHNDKIKLIKKPWWRVFSYKNKTLEFKLSELSEFRVATPKTLMGVLEWETFDGTKGTFTFTTNAKMMGMIEKYVHKLIVKNNQTRRIDIDADAA